MLIRRLARPMLAAAFVNQGMEALNNPIAAEEAVRPTVEGLQKMPDAVANAAPRDPGIVAKVTAAIQIAGALLLATGKMPRLAAATLAATVIPANLGAHMFWNEIDPTAKSRKRREFMVDVSLLGGLIIASADTAGKPSLGWRGRYAARRLSQTASTALGSAGTTAAVGGIAGKVGHSVADAAGTVGHRVADATGTVGHGVANITDAARHRLAG